MKKIKKLFYLLPLLLSISCKKNENLNLSQKDTCNECYVDITEAKNVASIVGFTNYNSKTRTASVKEIENITEVPDIDNKIAYYIINYNGGGFVILSGDRRINPILAYSDVSTFPLNEKIYPTGISEWLENASNYVSAIRSKNTILNDENIQMWSDCMISRSLGKKPGDGECVGGCPNKSYSVGPLLQTLWHQNDGFNNYVPLTGCADSYNGRAPVGCVATAMGQIMKYHKHPASYNWNNMYNTSGSDESARLMIDIGTAVNMVYGCKGSSANTQSKAASAFKNNFGYSSAIYGDFNYQTVEYQLNAKKPVILRGGDKSGWWIFGSYVDGHAWVCDGYQRSLVYSSDCNNSWEYTYLHMNWGWGSSAMNGWFSANDWTIDSHNFNYKKGMVYNITP